VHGARRPSSCPFDPKDREYLAAEVQPLLDEPLVDFAGEVGGEKKLELLAHARGLLFPIDWPEPIGLVMIEALACGTPIVARRRGSVPEILLTAKPVSSARPTMSCVTRQIDRSRCREDFERRFTDAKVPSALRTSIQTRMSDR
jgi:glycosyltransferase involved in cell wall biosynthesis